MAESELIELFHSCDKSGTGRIGPDEFRKLCAEFEIEPADSDAIFVDLDHDGDGQVSLNDFAWGFRHYLNPKQCTDNVATTLNARNVIRRRSDARLAWSHLVDGIGQPAVYKFLNTSGKKLEELYHELQTAGGSPELVSHFEGALSSLLLDVKRLHDDNQKLEQMFNKEKEAHLQRLKGLEEELDAQVAKVEEEAREEARLKFEQEKKEIMQKMESEMAELQTHLRLFQKVNTVLSQKKEEKQNLKHDAAFENQELRSTLTDTRTNLAMVYSEMASLKAEYETKCRELNSHQEAVMQYVDQNKHVQRQLIFLQEANKNLQDTNERLLNAVEGSYGRISRHCSRINSAAASVTSENAKDYQLPDILCSEGDERTDILLPQNIPNDSQFAIQRLMDDIDSGHSTLRDAIECDSDHKSLHDELGNLSDSESALKSIESDDSKLSYPYSRNKPKVGKLIKSSSVQSCEAFADPDRTYKLVFAGDAAVGKSCFIHRFCKGTFANKLGSTLGVDFQIKTIRVDEKNIALQLWDTAGQERFRAMTKAYFRRADGIVLLFDVTSERTFLNVRGWIQSISEAADKEIPVLICGNKADLKEELEDTGATCVERKYAEALANEYKALYFETSSKTGKNISNALIAISREMLLREDVEVQTSALRVSNNDNKVAKSSLCRCK